jgi:hypoxia up-regulated 1
MNTFRFVLLITQLYATVIGIDYGTDWLKVSVIKPGGQIETVLNRESKRKTNAVLNIRKGTRSFGIEAQTLGMRFPTQTYSSLKSLLGKKFVHEHTKEYQSLYTNEIFQCSRETVCFKHDEEMNFELEELVANLFSHCKQQAENYADINVSGAVITVPFHFTQFERRAILDAAEIAGLKVYALINDQTAGITN